MTLIGIQLHCPRVDKVPRPTRPTKRELAPSPTRHEAVETTSRLRAETASPCPAVHVPTQRVSCKGADVSRIVLTTVGSFGDLHPKIALAMELRRRGHEIVFATHREYKDKIERLGFAFHRMRPDAVALSDPYEMARMMHLYRGQEYVIRRWLMPSLETTYEDLQQAATNADLIIAGEGVFAARLVAERHDIPWICTVLQPLSFLSVHDQFVLPGLPLPAWLRASGPKARKFQLSLIRMMTARWSDPVKRLRQRLGLPPLARNLFIDEKFSPDLVLALFSTVFAQPQIDWPAGVVATGFPLYDGAMPLASELSDFLRAGQPPIVFTLGSSAIMAPGCFFDESLAAARRIGRRAILLVGNNPPPKDAGADCLAVGYAPFSQLFPHACAIVHQGGIGTTGQALRAGRPTLIVPYSLDQPDNAARAERLGASLTVPRRRYRARHVAEVLRTLLDRPEYALRARDIGDRIRGEDAVGAACDAIAARLASRQGASRARCDGPPTLTTRDDQAALMARDSHSVGRYSQTSAAPELFRRTPQGSS